MAPLSDYVKPWCFVLAISRMTTCPTIGKINVAQAAEHVPIPFTHEFKSFCEYVIFQIITSAAIETISYPDKK